MKNKFVYNPAMYYDEVEDIVKRTIIDLLGVEPEDVTSDANLIHDLGCDSLDIIELVCNLEKVLSISIPDEVYEKTSDKVATVGFSIDIAKKLINGSKIQI